MFRGGTFGLMALALAGAAVISCGNVPKFMGKDGGADQSRTGGRSGSGGTSGTGGTGVVPSGSGGRATGGQTGSGTGGAATGGTLAPASGGAPATGGGTGSGGAVPGSGGATGGGSGGRGMGSAGGRVGGTGTGGATLKAAGTPCSASSECASDSCGVEGVCCNIQCVGQCESCLSPTNRGTCVPVTTPRTPCDGTGTCGGKCDGIYPTTCVYPSATTVCGAASCTNNVARPPAMCNGWGGCVAPLTSQMCDLGCDGTVCSKCRTKSSTNLLTNPGFDGSATPWGTSTSYSTNDYEGCATSGSYALDLNKRISQCLPATAGVTYHHFYRFKGWDSTQSHSGMCGFGFYSSAGCTGTPIRPEGWTLATSSGEWTAAGGGDDAPAGTVAVQFYCSGSMGHGFYDQLYFGTDLNGTF